MFQINTSGGSVILSNRLVRLTVHWIGQPAPSLPKSPSKSSIGLCFKFFSSEFLDNFLNMQSKFRTPLSLESHYSLDLGPLVAD